MIPFTWNAWVRQIHRDKQQISGYQGQEKAGVGEQLLSKCGFPFGARKKIWNYLVVNGPNATELFTSRWLHW
jgi:hypothetical protein